jgi:uncharacterized membrane protein
LYEPPWDPIDLVPDTNKQEYPNPVANYLVGFGCFFLGISILVHLVRTSSVGTPSTKPVVWTLSFLFGAALVIAGILVAVKSARRDTSKPHEP